MKSVKGEEIAKATTVFFGSIGSIAETSEIQLEAYNRCFSEFGLSWRWSRSQYESMLVKAGGEVRIQDYALATKTVLSNSEAADLYQKKSDLFLEIVKRKGASPRAGVVELMNQCKKNNVSIAWITTTTLQNIDAIQSALGDQVDFELFSFISNLNDCVELKPSPEIYIKSVKKLGGNPDHTVVVEDSNSGVLSAKGAGLYCIATPGDYKTTQDFSRADIKLTDLACLELLPDSSGSNLASIKLVK